MVCMLYGNFCMDIRENESEEKKTSFEKLFLCVCVAAIKWLIDEKISWSQKLFHIARVIPVCARCTRTHLVRAIFGYLLALLLYGGVCISVWFARDYYKIRVQFHRFEINDEQRWTTATTSNEHWVCCVCAAAAAGHIKRLAQIIEQKTLHNIYSEWVLFQSRLPDDVCGRGLWKWVFQPCGSAIDKSLSILCKYSSTSTRVNGLFRRKNFFE